MSKNKTSGWKVFGIAALIGGGIYAALKIYNNYKVEKEVKEMMKKTELANEDAAKEAVEDFEKNQKEAIEKEIEKIAAKNPNPKSEEEIEDIQNYLYPQLDYKTATTEELQKIFSRVNYVLSDNGYLNKYELIDLKTFERYPAGKTPEEDPFDYDFFKNVLIERANKRDGNYIFGYTIIDPNTGKQVQVYNPYPKKNFTIYN